MAVLCRCLALLLILLVGLAGASAADPPAAGTAGLYDRPVLVVDPGMHTARIWRAAADKDGRWAVTGSDDKTVRIWSLADGALLRTIRLPAGPGDLGKVNAVAISPDGALVAAGGWTRWTEADPQEQIYLFDRATGVLVKRIEGLPNQVLHVAFSPDGARLAAVLGGKGLRVYARETGWAEAARDEDYGDQSYGADFAPGGRLATTSWDGKVRLYSADPHGSARPVRVVQAPGGKQPVGIAFNPDGARLAVGYEDTTGVDRLDASTLVPLARPDTGDISNGNLAAVAWSRDGATLFAAGRYFSAGNRPVLAWDAGGAGAGRLLPAAGLNTAMSLVPLPNGDLLVASGDPWLARLALDGTPRWRHEPPAADFRSKAMGLSVSGDGTRIAFRFDAAGKSPAHFDLATRTLIAASVTDAGLAVPRQAGLPVENWQSQLNPTLGGKALPLDQYEISRSLAVHPDGHRFVLGSEWTLRAFDAHGTRLWTRPAPGAVWAVNITGDGRLVVAAYSDGTIRWHRMSDGVELLAFMPLADRTNWVTWTPEGFYTATPGAQAVLRWHVNRGWDHAADSVPVEKIPGYEQPGLPPLILQELETPRALGIAVMTQVRQTAMRKLDSAVPPGPQLHLLAIGISKYNTANAKSLQVQFADRDANGLASKIVATQAGLYTVKPQVLPNEDAGKASIMQALATMQSSMENGSGNDLAVVFFSGHGAMLDGELYLLPYDVDTRTPALEKATALSIDELSRELRALARSGRVLVLLDACHSGATTINGALAMDSTQLGSALRAANITVLTSSSGTEVSREDPAWQHGAFTKVLLDAFSDPQAIFNPEKKVINGFGLANYLFTQVPKLTGDTQHPGIDMRSDGRFDSTLFASGS
jgi:WD40 repeat protein